MIRKRLKRLMAVTLTTSLCVGMLPMAPVSFAKSDAVTEQASEEAAENTYQVEIDATGNVVSDNALDLEQQKFNWDNVNMYFVLTDRFKNADKSNDHSYGRGLQADGKTAVEGLDTYTNPGTFHGGDLKGLTEKVEDGYFTDLGVNAIWITAPYEQVHGYTSANVKSNNANVYPDPDGQGFPYYSYHGYWTLDYTNIDANMGTAQDFEDFVDSCHKKGIRVVMDIVMNHVGYTTMQDAVDYGFDGALKGDWKSYYYGNSTSLMGGDPESTNYWDKESSAWSKWWGAGFVRANYPGYDPAGGDDTHMSLSGLPDVITESTAKEVSTPPILTTKWTKEGRLAQEQQELDDYFKRTGNKKQARYYIIKWLTDWVREYGVDGFRCDTAKHVDKDAWKDLKTEAVAALKEWRTNNPDKPGAEWTDDFWMTGEAWGHGVGKSEYYSNGFDSMINFSFPKDGNIGSLEKTYSNYASMINSDPDFNALSYVASHDDAAGAGVFEANDAKSKNLGTSLLLAPGGVQIYYGNEVNRQIGWKDFFTGSDYLDQRYRTDMDWDNVNQDVLEHWQKVGTFRNKHMAVGAGQHEMLESTPYTFSRTYNLEEEDEDKVVCCIPGQAGTYDVNVGDVFEEGETVTDAYSGKTAQVSNGKATFTCDSNGVILIQGSGIVKASVNIKSSVKTDTYRTDTIAVTLKANKATDTMYQINNGTPKRFTTGDVITIGGDTAYEEETTLTVTGVSEDDGSALSKTVTYKRSAEPEISDGTFGVLVSKADFPTAPNIFVYTNDDKETALNGAWPGELMTEADDPNYWSFTKEDLEGDACIILSLGATSNTAGTWRSTAEKAKGLVVKGYMSYDKTTGTLTEEQSGEPGKVTVNYVDQNGTVLKSIYRVGAVGKKYVTYPSDIDGYTLTKTPDNAEGVFEKDGTITYVYTQGGEIPSTPVIRETGAPSGDDVTPTQIPDFVTQAPVRPSTTPGHGSTTQPTATAGTIATNRPDNGGTLNGTPSPTATAQTMETPSQSSQVTPTAAAKATPSPTATAQDKALSVSLKSDKASPQKVGSQITLTAEAAGGSGKYQYCFYTSKSDGSDFTYIQKEYTTKNEVVWTPEESGTYIVTVGAKDTENGSIKTAQMTYKITDVSASYKITKIAIAKNGAKLKFKTYVSGQSGTVKYKYVLRGVGKKYVSKYSTNPVRTMKVKRKGKYRLTVYAKSKNGIVSKGKTIKVN